MNTLNTYTKVFHFWWQNLNRSVYGTKDEALKGWTDCMLKQHEINDKGSILRGTDAYCLGWNAAVEFILGENYDDKLSCFE